MQNSTSSLSLRNISLCVIVLHSLLILWMMHAASEPKPPAKPRLVVQNVRLNPKQPKNENRMEKEILVDTAAAETPPSTQQEVLSIESLPRFSEDAVKAVEVRKLETKPLPTKKHLAAPTLPTQQPRQKPLNTAPSKTKAATVSPPKKKGKSESKPIKSQTKPKAPSSQVTAKTASKSTPSPSINSKNPSKNRELLAKAQESIAKIRTDSVKIDANPNEENKTLKIPVLALAQVDSEEASSLNQGEQSYRDEIARRLKLALVLPERGIVQLKLTLTRSGGVSKLVLTRATSEKNRLYVEKTLPTLYFPPFGNQFNNKEEHTFTINLSHDF